MDPEPVPGAVHSLAFFPDGRALWCAQRAQIVVRAWPSLDVVNILPIACTRLAAHPTDPVMLVALRPANGFVSDVIELDAGGTPAAAPIVLAYTPLALAGDARGGVLTAYHVSGNQFLVMHATRDAHAEVRTCWLDRGALWLALLPRTQQMFAAVHFTPPIRFDLTRLAHDHGWTWPQSWPSRAPWTSVDVATDERAAIVSDDAGATHALHLETDGSAGRVVRFIDLVGGIAHAVHPSEPHAATLDAAGALVVHDLHTGARLSVRARAFDAGGARGDALR